MYHEGLLIDWREMVQLSRSFISPGGKSKRGKIENQLLSLAHGHRHIAWMELHVSDKASY